jgi:hypothetical protein
VSCLHLLPLLHLHHLLASVIIVVIASSSVIATALTLPPHLPLHIRLHHRYLRSSIDGFELRAAIAVGAVLAFQPCWYRHHRSLHHRRSHVTCSTSSDGRITYSDSTIKLSPVGKTVHFIQPICSSSQITSIATVATASSSTVTVFIEAWKFLRPFLLRPSLLLGHLIALSIQGSKAL